MENRVIVTNIDRIIFVGEKEYKEETSTFGTTRPFQELTLFLSGETTIRFDDQVLRTKNDVISYLPDGQHERYVVERNKKGDCIIIYFNSVKPIDKNAFILDIKNSKCETLFKKIFSVWAKKDNGYYYECLSLFYKILSEMQKTKYLTETQFQKIKPAIDYVKENYLTKNISSQDLVSLCGISYSYIKKIFALKYKTSPKKFIIHLKMKHACSLLSSGEHSVSSVSEACGYSDVYFFSHQFKEYIGVSPATFIKTYKSSKK